MRKNYTILIFLRNFIKAFDIQKFVSSKINRDFKNFKVITVNNTKDFVSRLQTSHFVITWHFKKKYYKFAHNLLAIFTPAAGNDWVKPPKKESIEIFYGKFHGEMIAQSLLGAMLFFNRRLDIMLKKQHKKVWDRNAQNSTQLLKDQTVFFIGYGNIAQKCASVLNTFGVKQFGFRRSKQTGFDTNGVEYVPMTKFNSVLKKADHVVLLLPSGKETTHFFKKNYFRIMKKDACLYNFGRGNSINNDELHWALSSKTIRGAAIDVFDAEPLPKESKLWELDNILITPHSSCIYNNYKEEFYKEFKIKFDNFLVEILEFNKR